jgi:NADH dehydrogenase
VVFGPEDTFLNRFAAFARFLPVIAVPCPQAKFQPVYVGDVARAMVESMDDMVSHGFRYDLAGPRVYTMKELVELVCRILGRERLVVGLSDRLSYFQASVLEKLPGPLMSRDNYYSMSLDNVSDAPFPFGIEPQAIEAVAPLYLLPSGPRERRYTELRSRHR